MILWYMHGLSSNSFPINCVKSGLCFVWLDDGTKDSSKREYVDGKALKPGVTEGYRVSSEKCGFSGSPV
jgi:hypothetical protein